MLAHEPFAENLVLDREKPIAAPLTSTGSYRTRPPIALLGIPFDNITLPETVRSIERMISARVPHYLVTANVDFLVQALKDMELRRILLDANLVLCDGTPLVWASRVMGNRLPHRVAGSDLVPELIRLAAERRYKIFFLGGDPQTAKIAVEKIQAQYPQLPKPEYYSPSFKPLLDMEHEEIRKQIQAAQPDMLFVSFGCPKQEKWIAMHYRSLGVPVSIGVGGTIDFLAGRLKRAPRWMQQSGTEWIFRMLQEPKRLTKRYITDLWQFSGMIAAQWIQLHMPFGWGASRKGSATEFDTNWKRLVMPDRIDAAVVRDYHDLWTEAAESRWDCVLDMSGVRAIDSTGVGLLVRLEKKLRQQKRHLILFAPTSSVRRALALLKLQEFFRIAQTESEVCTIVKEAQAQPKPEPAPDPTRPICWLGEVTAANAEEVWAMTETQIQVMGALTKNLVIDLAVVRFIDSTGIGVMVRAKKLATQRGLSLRFINPQPMVRNVIHIARMDKFLLSELTQ